MTNPTLFDQAATAAISKASRAPVPQAFPDWLKRRMEAAGLMDPDTGATRRARSRYCPMCRSPVMRGIDEDWGGQSRDADPQPLSGLGEVMATMAGRATYELTWNGATGYLMSRRNASRITGRPCRTPLMDVLAEHQCNGGPALPGQATQIKDNTTPVELPDKAPF